MRRLVASVVGLAAIAFGASRWLMLLPWEGGQGHQLQWRGLHGGLAALAPMFRQGHAWGVLAGSGLVCVGVLVVLRLFFSSRTPVRRGAKKRALLFWGLAGGGTAAIHALLVLISCFRP